MERDLAPAMRGGEGRVTGARCGLRSLAPPAFSR